MALNIQQLQQQIAELGLKWQAGTTTNTDDTPLQAASKTGAVPPEGEPTLEEREATSRAAAAAPAPGGAPPPAAWDWRNVGGKNYVTPIQNQGNCGSCVAFGSVAAMDSWFLITHDNPNLAVAFSEAQLWFCYGPSHGAGACPAGGWWPSNSYPGMQVGLVQQSCYPYTSNPQGCNLCPNWQAGVTQISGWTTYNTIAEMKAALATGGPLTTCFTVYSDFYYHYTGGVYTYNPNTAGPVIGGHCVAIVGYNDAGGYWIAKNSWGSGWGEQGYFCMSYGSCGIDAEMWTPTGMVIPTAAAQSKLAGYATTYNNQQHVIFVNTANQVCELCYGTEWTINNLTLWTGAPVVAAGSHIDGYQTAFNNQEHVNFIGANNHVYELVYGNTWSCNDLTQLTGAPPAAPGSSLDGYATTFNNQQHVNYIGVNGHIYELVYGNKWTFNDLTVQSGAPAAAAGSALDGYETTFNNQQHVNFIGANGHVYELVYGNKWSCNDLTVDAKAPVAAAGSALDGYQTTFNNQQHVNFIGVNNHVYELVYGNAWSCNDLTATAKAPAAIAGSSLDGYQTTFNNQQHVNFIGANHHVYELVYGNAWSCNDLSQLTGAEAAEVGSPLDGYQTAFNNQQHVNFIGANSHVYELVYGNSWSCNDLTLTAI